jgi:polyisoprenoid-binding protein YceI
MLPCARPAALATLFMLASCSLTATQTQASLRSVGEGVWKLEKPHALLVWRVKHMGLSNYTARFADFDATLDFDPKNPAAARLTAVINPLSVRTDHPTDAGWDGRLGKDIFKGEQFPQIIFTSRQVEPTGEFTGKVTGDLAFLGQTHAVTLDVTFNGAAPAAALYQGRDAIGFSARGVLKRSEFGLTRYGAFVGDTVELVIEAEFTKAG